MIEFITEQGFKEKIFNYDQTQEWSFQKEHPIILNFTASWCGPCQMFAPVLQKVSDDFQGRVQIYKVDIDQCPEIPALFGIRSVPTTLFLKADQDPAMATGAMPYDALLEAISDLLHVKL